ncbi:uncharacterized protein ASCRUDRAFT_72592 [Ascoidea rubescens DSM 1968]|uniref:DBF4-type domain-containing protein n=1 Tax=Ascoidea rubescens DSM 1968 TaxID=1344418 RepID=A0A1D2V9T8_9ASCO|nr:hypothetical protein ASCRUDRAFT_72592 [Ascoidea rubescens DSM 1968]ODV58410.1 hypothetical protein ASCRUDRAFT_72592 [Ascoidea rubescens DSM 1968]
MSHSIIYFDTSNLKSISSNFERKMLNKKREIIKLHFLKLGSKINEFFDLNYVTIIITTRDYQKNSIYPKTDIFHHASKMKVWNLEKSFRFLKNLSEIPSNFKSFYDYITSKSQNYLKNLQLSSLLKNENLLTNNNPNNTITNNNNNNNKNKNDNPSTNNNFHFFSCPFIFSYDLKHRFRPIIIREWNDEFNDDKEKETRTNEKISKTENENNNNNNNQNQDDNGDNDDNEKTDPWPKLYASTNGRSPFLPDPSSTYSIKRQKERKRQMILKREYRQKLVQVSNFDYIPSTIFSEILSNLSNFDSNIVTILSTEDSENSILIQIQNQNQNQNSDKNVNFHLNTNINPNIVSDSNTNPDSNSGANSNAKINSNSILIKNKILSKTNDKVTNQYNASNLSGSNSNISNSSIPRKRSRDENLKESIKNELKQHIKLTPSKISKISNQDLNLTQNFKKHSFFEIAESGVNQSTSTIRISTNTSTQQPNTNNPYSYKVGNGLGPNVSQVQSKEFNSLKRKLFEKKRVKELKNDKKAIKKQETNISKENIFNQIIHNNKCKIDNNDAAVVLTKDNKTAEVNNPNENIDSKEIKNKTNKTNSTNNKNVNINNNNNNNSKPNAKITKTQGKGGGTNKRDGYCENCRVKYDDFEEHISTSNHKKFAENDKNFNDIDSLIDHLRRKQMVLI